MSFVPENPSSLTNELARERNREAADRTLLAWIRTRLAVISFGFGIGRLGQDAFWAWTQGAARAAAPAASS